MGQDQPTATGPSSEVPDARHLGADALLRVLEVTRRLAVERDLPGVLKQVIDAGREVLGADRGTVFLFDAQRGQLHSAVATGLENREIRFEVSQGIAGQCARTRQVVNVHHCYDDPRFSGHIDQQTGYRTRSLLAMPLIGLEGELVGVMQLLNPCKPVFDAGDEKLALILASQAAVAIQRAQLLEERLVKLKLEHDLALAKQIQLGVLPSSLPETAGYHLACYSQPADQTGGDIYDVVRLGSGEGMNSAPVMIMVADATGHGIGPALSVTQVRAMLRIGLRLGVGLDELVEHINQQLVEDLDAGRFVTAFVGQLDPLRHEVAYHAAGQGPVLHYRARDRRCDWHDASTVPLGILPNTKPIRPDPIVLEPGDILALLTDGFYEYPNATGLCFGRDRVEEYLTQNAHHRSADIILDGLVRELFAFANDSPQEDDLTALIIKRDDQLS